MIAHQTRPIAVLTATAIKALLFAMAFSSSANGHPHDLLAQCQIKKNGKLVWVMCDELDKFHRPLPKPKPKSRALALTDSFKLNESEPFGKRFRK